MTPHYIPRSLMSSALQSKLCLNKVDFDKILNYLGHSYEEDWCSIQTGKKLALV